MQKTVLERKWPGRSDRLLSHLQGLRWRSRSCPWSIMNCFPHSMTPRSKIHSKISLVTSQNGTAVRKLQKKCTIKFRFTRYPIKDRKGRFGIVQHAGLVGLNETWKIKHLPPADTSKHLECSGRNCIFSQKGINCQVLDRIRIPKGSETPTLVTNYSESLIVPFTNGVLQ